MIKKQWTIEDKTKTVMESLVTYTKSTASHLSHSIDGMICFWTEAEATLAGSPGIRTIKAIRNENAAQRLRWARSP